MYTGVFLARNRKANDAPRMTANGAGARRAGTQVHTIEELDAANAAGKLRGLRVENWDSAIVLVRPGAEEPAFWLDVEDLARWLAARWALVCA